jgi:hypothetical protein
MKAALSKVVTAIAAAVIGCALMVGCMILAAWEVVVLGRGIRDTDDE